MLKIRLTFAGLACLAAGLVACGGGGGGGATTPPVSGGGSNPTPTPVTATPTPTPTATPASAGFRPAAVGDHFVFNGTLTRSNVFSFPSPSPLPSTTTTATVQQVIDVTNAANPFGFVSNAVDFHAVETDTLSLQTTTTTSDSWYADIPSGNGFQFSLLGTKSQDSNAPTPDQFTYAYGAPQLVDELPETNGASWTNSPAVIISEADADGTSAHRQYAANGTYTETQNLQISGFTTAIAENADGSGSYSGNALFGGQVSSLTMTAPQAAATPFITVSLNFTQPPTPSPNPSGSPSPTPNPTNPPIVVSVPLWYPSTPQLYNESDSVTTGVTFPGSCNVPSVYGTAGDKVHQSISRLDTVLGFTDALVADAYVVQGVGPVCAVLTDTQTTFYDYLNDQLTTFVFSNAPQQTSTLTETLTLAAGATIKPFRATSSLAGGAALAGPAFTVARARFMTLVERERSDRTRALREYLTTRLNHRGGARGL